MSQQINLFNPIFMKQQKQFSLLAMVQALVLIVACALLFYGYAAYQVTKLSAQAEESTRLFNAEQVRQVAILEPGQQDVLLQNEVQQMEQKLAEQSDLVESFKSGVMGNDTGYSEYMRAFARQAVQGLWLTGFTLNSDEQISLAGGVVNPELLPVYIQRLGREKIMSGKKFTDLQMYQPRADAIQADPASKVRYVEFSLYSSSDDEDKR